MKGKQQKLKVPHLNSTLSLFKSSSESSQSHSSRSEEKIEEGNLSNRGEPIQGMYQLKLDDIITEKNMELYKRTLSHRKLVSDENTEKFIAKIEQKKLIDQKEYFLYATNECNKLQAQKITLWEKCIELYNVKYAIETKDLAKHEELVEDLIMHVDLSMCSTDDTLIEKFKELNKIKERYKTYKDSKVKTSDSRISKFWGSLTSSGNNTNEEKQNKNNNDSKVQEKDFSHFILEFWEGLIFSANFNEEEKKVFNQQVENLNDIFNKTKQFKMKLVAMLQPGQDPTEIYAITLSHLEKVLSSVLKEGVYQGIQENFADVKFINLLDLFEYIQRKQKDNLDEDYQRDFARINLILKETFSNYSYYIEKELQAEQPPDNIDSPKKSRLFSSS